MPTTDFPFIVSNGPKVQNDPAVRRTIRKQAMKDAGAARRKRGGHGRVNLIQLPLHETTNAQMWSSENSPDSASTSSLSSNSTEPTPASDDTCDELIPRRHSAAKRSSSSGLMDALCTLTPIRLASDYECARASFEIDIADLSMLTNFHVGKGAMAVLGADVANLATLLSSRTWSFVEFVPSRYGSSECLTAATNCVLAKVKSLLAPQKLKDPEIVLRLYSKALQTLQDAISDKSSYLDADVLCATQLLSLYEVLDPARGSAWDHHILGAMRLVKTRTPARFKTEFEKALFAAHVGPTMSVALMGGMPNFLGHPEWQELYHSLAIDSDVLTDRSPLTIRIRSVMLMLPDLWHHVEQAVRGPGLFDDDVLKALASRLRDVHRTILAWTEDYKAHCVRWSLVSPPQSELAMRRELLGSSLECLVILKRLLASVADEERLQLEVECQALAVLLLDLQKQPSSKHSCLFSGHEVGVAYTIEFTKDQWEDTQDYASDYDRRIACRTRLNAWTSLVKVAA